MKSSSNADQVEIIFKPSYSLRIRASVYLYPLGVAVCIIFIVMGIFSRSIFPYGIYAIVFGFLVLNTIIHFANKD